MTRNVAALLTPAGISAVAVIGASGPEAWERVRPGISGKQPPHNTTGELFRATLRCEGLGDNLMIFKQELGTGQRVEFQCHGGPGVVNWLWQWLEQLGFEIIDWREWNKFHGSDAIDQELWNLLAQTTTTRTAAILLDQCQGAFAKSMDEIRKQLADPHVDRKLIQQAIDRLKKWESLGRHLIDPWRVVIAGATNAGKSTLMNAMLGYERAITSPCPGTTRDLLSGTLVLNGFPLILMDTAGLRESQDGNEREGMLRTKAASRVADVVLGLVDLSDENAKLPEQIPFTLTVGTKSDLPRMNSVSVDLTVSARTNDGLHGLLDAVFNCILPVLPRPGQGIPVTAKDREILNDVTEMLQMR